jgi:hypothetical protein
MQRQLGVIAHCGTLTSAVAGDRFFLREGKTTEFVLRLFAVLAVAMYQSCCARRRVVAVAVAFSFAALPMSAPSLFADQIMYFQVANYPDSQSGYDLSGKFQWDLTTETALAAPNGSFTITPSGGTPSTYQLTGEAVQGPGALSVQPAGSNELALLLPTGDFFALGSTGDATHSAVLFWVNNFEGSAGLEATTGGSSGQDNVVYANPPSPLDAVGLPSNGPWIIGTASYLPGDVNFDGTVNGLDIADLASHWLQTGLNGGIAGDANFDGTVNGLDIAVISSHWLATSAGGSGAAVPEPSTIVLAIVGGLALLAYRRRR